MRLLDNPLFGTTPTEARSPAIEQSIRARRKRKSDHNVRCDKLHQEVLRDLCSVLPSKDEMQEMLSTKSSWWPLWRDSLGLKWGGENAQTLAQFAALALSEREPRLIGILLIAFAICSGDLGRYVPPVETRIMYNEHLARTENGLCCLMALGLCYLNALQPRRAWVSLTPFTAERVSSFACYQLWNFYHNG
jgi:hypothetical protein